MPVIPVGKLVLNRNPDNFFAETEQVAFCAAHVVPGIDFTNDPLLAGRIHSYVDTQISRLGGAELPRDPDQRADRAGAQQPARRHAPPGHQPRPRRLRAELARRRLSVPGRRRGLRVVPRAAPGRRSQGPRQAGAVRRSLHAGDAVLEQPDAGREDAHRQRVPLRAVEGADAGDPRAHGVRAAERGARARPGGRRGARHPRPAGADAEGPAGRRHARSHGVAGAVAVRAARRRRASRRGASPSSSPTAATASPSRPWPSG